MILKKITLSVVVAFVLLQWIHADIKLPTLISDNMVLQQGENTCVWGWADEDELVNIEFQGKKYQAKPVDGRWKIQLENLEVGGPYTMKLWGYKYLEVNNILVGEVWLGGGQSNMMWKLNESARAEGDIAKADYPEIRLFVVPYTGADTPQEDCPGRWVVCTPETVGDFSAIEFYFGEALYQELKTPMGLVLSGVGGTRICSWTSEESLKNNPESVWYYDYFDKIIETFSAEFNTYLENRDKGLEAKKPKNPFRRKPSAYYNAMIAPMFNLNIRGVIWYQGESDSWRSEPYERMFSDMISEWRKNFGQEDLPFLFVQLAGYNGKLRVHENYPFIREAQFNVSKKLKNTAMAVAIDVGEEFDIHPKNKKTVGLRLALAAKALVYEEDIEYSGPVFDLARFEDENAYVYFSHAQQLLIQGEKLMGFELADDNWVFYSANAVIDAGKVIVSSGKVKSPKYIRYAWGGYPHCNLVNEVGLPAVPFRTDSKKCLSKSEWEALNPGKTVEDLRKESRIAIQARTKALETVAR